MAVLSIEKLSLGLFDKYRTNMRIFHNMRSCTIDLVVANSF